MVATAIYSASVTLLPWCCGKKPHFLFAEPWKRNVVYIIVVIVVVTALLWGYCGVPLPSEECRRGASLPG